MIGKVITIKKELNPGVIETKKWIIFDLWGDRDEYLCVTDFETQTINELIPKDLVKESDMEDVKVEWLFLLRRKINLKGLEAYL
jgi:hypothetical protein